MKTGTMGALLVASVMIAGPVMAQPQPQPQGAEKNASQCMPPGGPGEKDMARHHQKMAEELGLSKEQAEKMEAFHKDQFAKMKEVREKMQASRKALRDVLDAETLDQGRAAQLTGDLKQQFSAMVDLRLQGIVQLRSILTPEQFAKMKARMQEHHKTMEARHDKKRGSKPGEGGKDKEWKKGPHGEDAGDDVGF